jgi:ATP-dependent Clp protease protease subunit
MNKYHRDFIIDVDFENDDIKKLTKTVLPDPDLLTYYNQVAKRELFINEFIDEYLIDYSKLIIDWNFQDRNLSIEEKIPIKIFINTNGGCLNSALNLINIMQLSKTPIYTIAMGKAYSAGALLLMAGNKGKRFIFPDTSVLIHDGSTGAIGDTGKVIDSLEFTQKQEERLKKYILANTNITPKLYEKNYRRDWFLFSDEIINYSIADKIISDLDDVF